MFDLRKFYLVSSTQIFFLSLLNIFKAFFLVVLFKIKFFVIFFFNAHLGCQKTLKHALRVIGPNSCKKMGVKNQNENLIIGSKYLPANRSEFAGIGVRIEDDVLITSQGINKLSCKVLSDKCPKTVEQIEKLMTP